VGGRNNICIKRKRVYNTTTGASLKISRMKIVSNTNWISFRPIFYGLVIVFLLGPPLAFSHYLSTSCNIFYQKQIEKKGPCGHRALISQERPLESGIVFVLEAGLGNKPLGIVWKPLFPLSNPCLAMPDYPPLRC
jgi:hypothetical protein